MNKYKYFFAILAILFLTINMMWAQTITFYTGGTTGTASWSTEQIHSGSRSAKLATITTNDRGAVRIEYTAGILKLEEMPCFTP